MRDRQGRPRPLKPFKDLDPLGMTMPQRLARLRSMRHELQMINREARTLTADRRDDHRRKVLIRAKNRIMRLIAVMVNTYNNGVEFADGGSDERDANT